MSEKKSKKLTFAEAFAELETITSYFEQQQVDLDVGLKKFERGLELATLCKEKLAVVEANVKDLSQKFKALSDESL